MHLQVENVGLRGISIGLRGSQRPLRIGIVQGGQHKSLVHVHAFGKKHTRDAPGDLRRYRGAPLRRDISAGVEQRLWPSVRSVRRGDLHRRRLMHVRVDAAHDQERDDQDGKNNRDDLSGVSGAALVSLDAQPSEVMLYRCFRHSRPSRFALVLRHLFVWRQHKITPQDLQTDASEEKGNTARFSKFLDRPGWVPLAFAVIGSTSARSDKYRNVGLSHPFRCPNAVVGG